MKLKMSLHFRSKTNKQSLHPSLLSCLFPPRRQVCWLARALGLAAFPPPARGEHRHSVFSAGMNRLLGDRWGGENPTGVYETSLLPLCVWCLDYPRFNRLDCSFPSAGILLCVDPLASNKESGFSPRITLNTNTEAFLLAGLFSSGKWVSFRVFSYMVGISQWASWFLGSHGQGVRQFHTWRGSHKPLFLGTLSRSHFLLSGCRSIQAWKSSVNRDLVFLLHSVTSSALLPVNYNNPSVAALFHHGGG